MARISLLRDKSGIRPEHHGIFDRIAASRGRVGEVSGPFPLLLHAPELAERVAELGAFVRFESPLSALEREIVVLVVATELGCEYEWTTHVDVARGLGLSEHDIAVIQSKTGQAEGDDALVAFARRVVRNEPVDPKNFAGLVGRFGEAGLVVLTATVGYYALLAYLFNTFDVRE